MTPGVLTNWLTGIIATPAHAAPVAVVVCAFIASTVFIVARMRSALLSAMFIVAAFSACLSMLVFLLPPVARIATDTPALLTDASGLPALDDHRGDVIVLANALQQLRDQPVADVLSARRPGSRTVIASDIDEAAALADSRALAVAGYGVAAQDWFEARTRVRVEALSELPAAPTGLRRIEHPRVVRPGELIEVTVDALAPAGDCRVEIVDRTDAVLAQQPLPDADRLNLQVPPQPSGRHLVHVVARCADQEPFAREPVAFAVRAPELARVLMLLHAPSFESRFVMRWLERSGASVMVRTQISDARFAERFIGREPRALQRVSAQLLAEVDLVVMDAQSLALLDNEERAALLADAGHGVLVTISDSADTNAAQTAFPGMLESRSETAVTYQSETATGLALPLLTRVDVALNTESAAPLLSASDAAPLVVRVRDYPHVSLSLLVDSYRWALSGEATAYASLWSPLVETLARPRNDTSPRIADDTLRVGTRARVCATAGAQALAVVIGEADGSKYPVALQRSDLLPGLHCGWFWPQHPGWLRASIAQSSSDVFVYPAQARHIARAHQARAVTRQLVDAGRQTPPRDNAADARSVSRAAVPRHWALIALLVSLLASWALQRIGQPSRSH
ncbi:MAG: hypothetical protein AAFO81_12630 [Pseudomonadota bacterium]